MKIFDSQTRGFANYDVSNSEYTNTLVQKDALKKALTNGIQLMNIIVQSKDQLIINKNAYKGKSIITKI